MAGACADTVFYRDWQTSGGGRRGLVITKLKISHVGPNCIVFHWKIIKRQVLYLFRNYSLSELEGTSEIMYYNPLILHRVGVTFPTGTQNPRA